MREKVTFAQIEQREVLSHIWQTCFQELPAVIDLFFAHYFEPENTLVYELEQQVVAMVHLLPAHIVTQRGLAQVHYIYAAATLPEHRSKGYMTTLLNHAFSIAAKRGDKYSVLLPAEESLYNYYGKLGYVPYFETRFVTLTSDELSALASGGEPHTLELNKQQLESLRSKHLAQYSGSVIWDSRAISYAAGVNSIYNGKLICTKSNSDFAYALCGSLDKDKCEIIELMADESSSRDLFTAILQQVPAQHYTFRLPHNSPVLNGRGTTTRFGMIKPLEGQSIGLPNSRTIPYLGLTLD